MSDVEFEPPVIPVHAALECAAAFVAEEVADDEQQEKSLPLAVLDFDHFPAAAALFGTLLDDSSDDRCIAMVELWVPLAEEDADAYDRAHAGHPMVRFLIALQHYKEDPIEALSFRVCVQHEAGFMQQVTRFEEMGVLGAVPEGVDPDDEGLMPPILPVTIDPGHIGWVELLAWRHRYTR